MSQPLRRPPDESPSSVRANAEDVFEQLRADILAGLHAPGAKLKFAELGVRYQASVSVLREALTRLAEHRLVTSEPRIGFRVATLSADDLRDLTWTRIQIETLAVRRAVVDGDVAWESALLAAHHTMERTATLTESEPRRIADDWEAAHTAFHRAVLAGCGSRWLLGIADGLRDCAELYRRWSGARAPQRDGAAEHRRILDATLARDADAACAALSDHYERTLAVLVERFEDDHSS